MAQPAREFTAGSGYRYGFNGKENDNSTGEGNLDFGARIYDTRIVRWLSTDPLQKKYPDETPYLFCGANPVFYKDFDGRDRIVTITVHNTDGTVFQVERTYNEFTYHKDSRFRGGYYYYKKDIIENIEIKLNQGGQTWQEAMKNPDNVLSYENKSSGWTDISAGDYYWNVITGGIGDESDKVVSGRWRIYGKGKDTDWQKGLPTAGEGTESINFGSIFDLVKYAKSAEKPIKLYELIKNPTAHKIFSVKEQVKKAAEAAVPAIENTKLIRNKNRSLNPVIDASLFCITCKQTYVPQKNGDTLMVEPGKKVKGKIDTIDYLSPKHPQNPKPRN